MYLGIARWLVFGRYLGASLPICARSSLVRAAEGRDADGPTAAEFFGWDETVPITDEQYARIHEKLHGHRQGP